MIKAVILDLDRTLLNSDKGISEYSLKVLNDCKEKGIRICIATARPLRTTVPYLELFPFDAATVMNGAKVICGADVDSTEMDKDETLNLLKKLGEMDYTVSLEMGDEVYANKFIPDYDFKYFENFPEIPKGEAPYKILVTLENESALKYIESILPKSMYLTVSGGHLIQIMNKDANKWRGTLKMLGYLGIKAEETMYIGDDYDDLEPIKRCGVGVAMGNAIEKAKEAADFITENNDSDGAVKAIINYMYLGGNKNGTGCSGTYLER